MVEPLKARVVWSSVRIEGVIETERALVLVQEITADWPAPVMAGWKLKLIVGAEPAATTTTLTEDDVDRPFESVAVATYVVFCVGETVAEPDIGKVPVPTAGEIENEAALVTFQDNVVDCP